MADNSENGTEAPHTQLPPFLSGYFLLAETDLEDPNFVRTVVLLVDHDAQGAFGLVVNRRAGMTLGQGAPGYAASPFSGVPVMQGGPVAPEYLFCLHNGGLAEARSAQSRCLVEGIWFEPDFDHLGNWIIAHPLESPPELRLFSGYSGWGPGQLEGELAAGAWVVLPASADLVFHKDPGQGWQEALKRKGGIWWLAATTGYKPNLN